MLSMYLSHNYVFGWLLSRLRLAVNNQTKKKLWRRNEFSVSSLLFLHKSVRFIALSFRWVSVLCNCFSTGCYCCCCCCYCCWCVSLSKCVSTFRYRNFQSLFESSCKWSHTLSAQWLFWLLKHQHTTHFEYTLLLQISPQMKINFSQQSRFI